MPHPRDLSFAPAGAHGTAQEQADARVQISREWHYAQVDVFSPSPFLGNPVAVILDASGLEPAQMQRIATWTNLSETTFVLPPTSPAADYRVRIFTPGGELPFAGHPTLGTAHAWLEAGGTPRVAGMVVQECAAGLVHVRATRRDAGRDDSRGDGRRDGPHGGFDDAHRLAFAAPPTLRSGDLDSATLASITRALGVTPADVVGHQWVDNGPGWAAIRLATAAQVRGLTPDLSLIPTAMVGVFGAHPPGSPANLDVRAFAPRIGVAEDPVCGSLNASLAQWLVRTGEVTQGYRATQGSLLGRDGVIEIEVDRDGQVWVGGATVTLMRGRINLG